MFAKRTTFSDSPFQGLGISDMSKDALRLQRSSFETHISIPPEDAPSSRDSGIETPQSAYLGFSPSTIVTTSDQNLTPEFGEKNEAIKFPNPIHTPDTQAIQYPSPDSALHGFSKSESGRTTYEHSVKSKEMSKETFSHAEGTPKNFLTTQWANLKAALDRHYILTNNDPAIVLPRPPSDSEKYSYVNTRRPLFLAIGLFAFLSASAGLWLFTLCAPYFYWYGPCAAVLQLHISLNYILGFSARDFDLEEHKRILLNQPITTTNNAPTVDVLLPVCREPLIVLRNTWQNVAKLHYPNGKLNIWVLDDGDQTQVKEMAEEFGFHYLCRPDRPYFKKAGNLRNAFQHTNGDFFVIFDADFCPRSDFLYETIPRMQADSTIAIVQTPQYFRTYKDNTWVERGASEVQELFYRWTQVNRNKFGGSICVGSNACYRREALKETGGTALVAASEDVHTGFYAITRGWKVYYIPICLASGISPDRPRAFFSQQIRWSQGSTSLLLNGHFHKAKLGFMTKLCFLSGMFYYWTTAFAMFTMPLPGLLIVWFRPDVLRYYNLAFALPSIVYGLLVFRFWSKGSYSLPTQQIGVMQGYAYLFGIANRIFGQTFEWVPSGTGQGTHKRSVYGRARFTAIVWTCIYQSTFFVGVGYRLFEATHGMSLMRWYDPIPQIVLYAFNLYITLPFLLSP